MKTILLILSFWTPTKEYLIWDERVQIIQLPSMEACLAVAATYKNRDFPGRPPPPQFKASYVTTKCLETL